MPPNFTLLILVHCKAAAATAAVAASVCGFDSRRRKKSRRMELQPKLNEIQNESEHEKMADCNARRCCVSALSI